MAEEAAAPPDVAASNAERPVEVAHSMSSEASPAPPAEGPMEETQADAADIAAAGDAAAAAPEESAAVTADGAASPDVPAAAASELGPSAEAVPGNQVPVGPAGVLEPVAEEPAAMQPDAAAAQGAPEGSAADVTAVAQVAKQPSVAFRLAGEGAAQQARMSTPVSRQLSREVSTPGSRPTSREVAAQIDGFSDDFRPTSATTADASSVTGRDLESEVDVDELELRLQEALQESEEQHRSLAEENATLQQRVRQVLEARAKGRTAARPAAGLDPALAVARGGLEERHNAAVISWAEAAEELARVEAHFESQTLTLQATLEERLNRSEETRKTFRHFLTEVARGSENTKNGRNIPAKVLNSYAEQEVAADARIAAVRLRHLSLTHQQQKLEATLKQKEELAAGLHLIDFEQLKIENQSLNEKIEERNEELLKLRKKTTSTVQVLTHVKEKLQYVEKENEALQAELEEVERSMGNRREQLTRIKAQRERLKAAAAGLREASSTLNTPALLGDVEIQKSRRADLREDLAQLQRAHSATTGRTAELTSRLLELSGSLRTQVGQATAAVQHPSKASAVSRPGSRRGASRGATPHSRHGLTALEAMKEVKGSEEHMAEAIAEAFHSEHLNLTPRTAPRNFAVPTTTYP